MVVCQFVHRTGLEITLTVDIGDGSSGLGMKRHPVVRIRGQRSPRRSRLPLTPPENWTLLDLTVLGDPRSGQASM